MGTTESKCRTNNDFVDNLIEEGIITSTEIEKAFRTVDRANYFLDKDRGNAYRNRTSKSGNMHMSAASVYVEVIEKLDLLPGVSFLNLGSGNGYFNTIIGVILSDLCVNHGIEIEQDVREFAIDKLEEFCVFSGALGHFQFSEPQFMEELDLNIGMSYDRVFCGRAFPIKRKICMKKLLKVGGILIMTKNDYLLKITRTSETTWKKEVFIPEAFTPTSKMDEINKFEPQSLLEICRSKVRGQISQRIYNTHATSGENDEPIDPKNKRCIIIPTFEEADLEINAEIMEMLHEMFDVSYSREDYRFHIFQRSLVCTGETRIYFDSDTNVVEDEPPAVVTRWSYSGTFANIMRAIIQTLPIPTVLRSYLNRE